MEASDHRRESLANSGQEMAKLRLASKLPLWSLVAANLVPLFGVLFFGWDAAILLVVYWAENLVVGCYSILRILAAHSATAGGHLHKIFLVPFFMIHFGGFCAIHGIFVFGFVHELGRDRPSISMFPDSDVWWGPLIFIGLLVNVITRVWETYGDSIWLPVTALFVSHGVSFVMNYLVRGEYRRRDAKALMAGPYGRIVLMHVAIIAAALPVVLFGSPTPLLVILIGLKILADVALHNASHKA